MEGKCRETMFQLNYFVLFKNEMAIKKTKETNHLKPLSLNEEQEK